jgi:hypothetical protein
MSQDNPTLISVPFHGDTIIYIATADGEFVPVTPLCTRLALNERGQIQRLNRDPDLWGACVIHAPSAGGTQEMNCIPRNRVAFFLATIDAKRVKPEVREKLRLYQREAADVLDRHFRKKAADTATRIGELERMLWHCHQQLRIDNPKWDRAFLMLERGDSDYIIAKRNNWTMDEEQTYVEGMRRCGMSPTWREDMGTLMDQNSDLKWKLTRLKQARAAEQQDLLTEG